MRVESAQTLDITSATLCMDQQQEGERESRVMSGLSIAHPGAVILKAQLILDTAFQDYCADIGIYTT